MTLRIAPRPGRRTRQQGVALVVALMFLLICTVIAIGASGRSLLQQRMANGLRQGQLAEMAAETTLRGAEWRLWSASANAAEPLVCGSGLLDSHCYRYAPESALYRSGGTVHRFRHERGWVDQGARSYRGPGDRIDYTDLAGNAQLWKNPVYIIEDLGVERPDRVTGTAFESGASGAQRTGHDSSARHIYRITARAAGAHPHAIRVVESTYAAKSD